MTALLCIAAALIPAAFAFGGHCAALSARDRIAAAYRAQNRAIRLAEDLQAELATLRRVAP